MRILSLLLALLLLGGTALAEEPVYYVATSSTSYLNVREEPTTDSKIITTLDRGATVVPTGSTQGLWVEIQTDARNITHHSDGTALQSDPLKGWVTLSLLSLEPPSNTNGTIVGDGRVRLRNDPDGDFLKWVQPGDAVSVLAIVNYHENCWRRVRHGDDRGWVMAEYLETE